MTKPNYSVLLDEHSLTFQDCRLLNPTEVRLELALGELFGLHVRSRDDLPVRVFFAPKMQNGLREFMVPLEGGLATHHLEGLPLPGPREMARLILDEDSFRVGVQRLLLDLIAPHCSLRITCLHDKSPPGMLKGPDEWKIELLWRKDEPIARWRNLARNVTQHYLEPA